jgi:hypothetical protein
MSKRNRGQQVVLVPTHIPVSISRRHTVAIGTGDQPASIVKNQAVESSVWQIRNVK